MSFAKLIEVKAGVIVLKMEKKSPKTDLKILTTISLSANTIVVAQLVVALVLVAPVLDGL